MGMNEAEDRMVANLLNSNLAAFLILYRFAISDRNLSIAEWDRLGVKVAKGVEPWQGKFMPSGGRLALANGYLSVIPSFTMELLANMVHAQFDKVRARFFWEGKVTNANTISSDGSTFVNRKPREASG